MGVRTTEHVKLSVEHADVAVMCLGLDATIEGEQGDAGNEYARKRHRSAMGGTQPECESHRGLLVSGARGGKVIAEMLFGEFFPSGKLPVRFYHGTENLPVWNIRDDYERREDIPAGSSGAGSGTAL